MNEYISKEYIRNVVLKHWSDSVGAECYAYARVLDDIDGAPVTYGQWIPSYTVNWWMGTEQIDGYTCNQCAHYYKRKSNYCPNCGVYMRGSCDGK